MINYVENLIKLEEKEKIIINNEKTNTWESVIWSTWDMDLSKEDFVNLKNAMNYCDRMFSYVLADEERMHIVFKVDDIYIAFERNYHTGKRDVYDIVTLMNTKNKDKEYNLCYQQMEESGLSNCYNCPSSILNLLTDTDIENSLI